MVEKKAVVDENKCAGCLKCIDYCEEGAIRLVPRPEPVVWRIDTSDVDQDQLRELCLKAHLHPDDVICPCTLTTAGEAAAAILKGARTPEDLSTMTGVRTACGVLCLVIVLELLRAYGIEPIPPKGYNWNDVEAALWNVPDEVIRKYSEYRLDESRKLLEERLDNPVSGQK
jgi:ferredoxin